MWLLLVVVGIEGVPPEYRLLELLHRLGEDGCRGTEGDSGIVIEDVFEDAT